MMPVPISTSVVMPEAVSEPKVPAMIIAAEKITTPIVRSATRMAVLADDRRSYSSPKRDINNNVNLMAAGRSSSRICSLGA